MPGMMDRMDEYLCRRQLKAIGPASGIYYNTPNKVDMQDLKWEIFYPVEAITPELIKDNDGFGIRRLPGTRVASIVHNGSYRKASSTYNRLEEFIQHEGFRVYGPAEEVYLSVFGISSEEQTMEIRLPIRPG